LSRRDLFEWRDRSRVGTSHLVFVHDLTIAAASLVVALYLRLGEVPIPQYADLVSYGTPAFVLIAAVTFHAFGMYRGVWRYASVPDLVAIVKAVTLAILVFLPLMFLANRLEDFPRSVPIIQWLVLVTMLGGPRFVYRIVRARDWKRSPGAHDGQVPVLLAGASDEAALFIRAMSVDPYATYRVVGILDAGDEHLGRSIHNVPVVGRIDQLERAVQRLAADGERPQRLILTNLPGRLDAGTAGALLERADALGLGVARLPSLMEFKTAMADGELELRPVALEDLLGRPQAQLDRRALSELVRGRRVLITGAGGTIGSELARQIAALAPARLILADNGEFNLYTIDGELRERFPQLHACPLLCDVRDGDRVEEVFAGNAPELVFHAAALKHVPMVETNPREGILTNVLGTQNVADAAARHLALAMVQISTDKAINPTSVLGASKRLAELYCQALDLAGPGPHGDRTGRRGNGGAPPPTRFMTVRFGNVLGSSGSVVPLFQRQLARGGPLTVTHPEVRRYFMTVREAVELVLQASAYGLAHPEQRGQIFVLDMGKPVRIVDVARQITRLAGLRPDVDVAIEFTGLRPGEKLYEELFDDDEERLPAAVDGVLIATSRPLALATLRDTFARLERASRALDTAELARLITTVLPSYRPAPTPAGAEGTPEMALGREPEPARRRWQGRRPKLAPAP